ncbi:MAG: cbb3-type cytochrome oxidase assembly protein CcoS [Calditrichaeota bacterium]|nr:MAG: cbb3-type cytochrome oxidase assembly protein CcoS [Calditrichota bacterium]
MSALFVIIAASLLVALGFLVAFLWAVRSGQFDDRYTPSLRILFDDRPSNPDPTGSNGSPSPDDQENLNPTLRGKDQ